MADALRALIGAVGLDVTHTAELEADPGSARTLRFPTDRVHHVWVATRSQPVWVGRGEERERLERGTAALLAPGAAAWIGTDQHAHPPPNVTGTCPDWGLGVAMVLTGVHHGTAAFGPLMPEALALPDCCTTVWRPDAGDDLRRTLEHLNEQVHRRWPGPYQDALARMLVLTVLSAWRPPVLQDNSLTRAIDAIADLEATTPPTVPELAALTRVSPSTLLRRFRATTGLTPDEFARWFRTLPVRAALSAGTPPDRVAADHGYPSVAAMHRVIRRVERTTPRLNRSLPDVPIPP